MADDDNGPDLAAGIDASRLEENTPLAGHVGEQAVILVRRGERVHALGAHCPHRGAALATGLVVGDTIRCPWHHASFALDSGAARAPSLDALPCWHVERDGDSVRVGRRATPDAPPVAGPVPAANGAAGDAAAPSSVVIVGAGAAGEAAAEALRAYGYAGPLTLLSADASLPLDRTNLSKGYLAGELDEAALALRDETFYRERDITLRRDARVAAIDPDAHELRLEGGETLAYGKLLIATGASPAPLPFDGADDARVHVLRSLEDARGILAALDARGDGGGGGGGGDGDGDGDGSATVRRAVVVGSGFIGLEVAAALRGRDIETTVVAPEAVPLGTILGEELGAFVRSLHERHGVRFRLETKVEAIAGDGVRLEGGEVLAADLIVVGIGVRPDTALAEAAGLAVDDGIVVDEHLVTSEPDILAAGDVASWPDRHGRRLRVEHWQLAQRHGQCAARNLLGAGERFSDVPFFWSKHYDTNIRYGGHAEDIARVETDGRAEDGDFEAVMVSGSGERLAMASVGRDRANLAFVAALEGDA